jgi:hypothetical protein
VLFNVPGPALEWKPMPHAQAPGDTPPARDRQARRLAERFSADQIDRKKEHYHLRLLTTPLYRHDTIDSPLSRGGALVAFCQQTDAELLLLIEARMAGAGYRWEYAVAGFSDMDLYLRLDGRDVWRDVPAFSSGRGAHSGGRVRFIDIARNSRRRSSMSERRKRMARRGIEGTRFRAARGLGRDPEETTDEMPPSSHTA